MESQVLIGHSVEISSLCSFSAELDVMMHNTLCDTDRVEYDDFSNFKCTKGQQWASAWEVTIFWGAA